MGHTTYGADRWTAPSVATRPPKLVARHIGVAPDLGDFASSTGGEARHQMPGDSTTYGSTIARATEATAKLQDEIDQLWSDAVMAADGIVCDRLVAVSHAIHRVFDVLDQRQVIG